MRLNTQTRYATRVMLDLAQHYRKGSIAIRDISKRQEVSARYMENLMGPFRSAGLVRTERGNRGGYVLAKDPSEITMADIFRILEGTLPTVPCVEDPLFCHRESRCVTRLIWCKLQKSIEGVLRGITLADMVEMQKELKLSDNE